MTDHARRKTARRYLELLLVSALLAGACAGTRSGVAPATSAPTGSADETCAPEPVTSAVARSIVDKYCVSCHSPTGAAGEDYDFRSDAAIVARRRSIEA